MRENQNILLKLLKFFLGAEQNYGLIGDIHEVYNYKRETENKLKSEIWLLFQVLYSIKHFFINAVYWGVVMLKNYLKVSFRNLARQKLNATINITGLSIGIAFSILILLFVRNEFSYDTFHENADTIFRVNKIKDIPGRDIINDPNTPMPFRDQIEIELPGVVNSARVTSSSLNVVIENEVFEEQVFFIDRPFFDMFSFPVILGNPESLLPNKNSVVISSEIAAKYFGNENPLNQLISLQLKDDDYDFMVTGVLDNKKSVSSYKIDMLIETDWLKKVMDDDWVWTFSASLTETFVQISSPDADDEFEAKLQTLAPHFEMDKENGKIAFYLQNLKDIRHDISLAVASAETSDPFYAYIMLGLGLLILFVACINFMTLNIGKSSGRAKEVGVRKVLGAFRGQVTIQYLSEAILTTFIATILGLLIALILLPEFNVLSGKELSISFDPYFIMSLLGVNLFVGLLAGSYPSFVLSGFVPAKVLKGSIKLSGKNIFSKILVVFQFSLSITLIICTLLFREQLNYIFEKDLGFDKESIIEVPIGGAGSLDEANKLSETFQNELRKNNRVINTASVFNNFGVNWTRITTRENDNKTNTFFVNRVDSNFLDVMNIKIVAGRNFSSDFATDYSETLIVNKAFLKHFQWDNHFDKQIPGEFESQHRIIGVVEDFNFHTLHSEVKPMVICQSFKMFSGKISLTTEYWPPMPNFVYVKVTEGAIKPAIDLIKNKWKEVAPDRPFDYKFLDATLEDQYRNEEKMNTIINYASIMAIIIAALGLFGLSTIAAESRIKEIGIRKVLGSSIQNIIYLVSKDLVKLIIFSNFIAWPIAYFVYIKWLENFAYRVDVQYLYFALATMVVLLVGIATIGYHSIKAARSNPIDSIRYE